VLLLQIGELGADALQLGGELIDGRLFLGEIAGDDQRLGDQVAGPAFVLRLALLVGLDEAAGLGLPSAIPGERRVSQ
jgi:hypothetical protein